VQGSSCACLVDAGDQRAAHSGGEEGEAAVPAEGPPRRGGGKGRSACGAEQVEGGDQEGEEASERTELVQVDEKLLWAAVEKAAGGRASATTPLLKKDNGTHANSPQDKLDLLRPVLLPVVEPATTECRTVEDQETQVSPPSSLCIASSGGRTHNTNDRHACEHAPSLPADPPISTSEATDAPKLP